MVPKKIKPQSRQCLGATQTNKTKGAEFHLLGGLEEFDTQCIGRAHSGDETKAYDENDGVDEVDVLSETHDGKKSKRRNEAR